MAESAIVAGFDVEEQNGSGRIFVGENGKLTGERVYKILWEDALEFSLLLAKRSWEVVGDYLVPKIPEGSWTLDDGTVLYCTTTEITGIGKPAGAPAAITYDWAIVTCRYQPLGIIAVGGSTDDITELGEIGMDFSSEYITAPRGSFIFADSFKLIDEPMGIQLFYQEVTVSLKNLETIPRSGIRACIGKVNDRIFSGAAIGTVLFLGATATMSLTDQAPRYDITFKFKERSVNWNHMLNGDGEWEAVCSTVGSVPPYPYADLGQLLRVNDE